MTKIILLLISLNVLANPSSSNKGSLNCNVDQPPILFGFEDRTILTYQNYDYDGNFSSLQNTSSPKVWPGTFGDVIELNLSNNRYVSALFNTGADDHISRLQFLRMFNPYRVSKGTTVAISQCPGDFSVHLNQSNCLVGGGGLPKLRWATDTTANSKNYCMLDKNTNYYLNIVNAKKGNNNYQTTECIGSISCGIAIIQINEQ